MENIRRVAQNIMQEITTEKKQSCLTDSKISSEVCPKCHGLGVIFYNRGNYEYAKDCDCGINQRKEEQSRLAFAEIPKTFEEVSLQNFRFDLYQSETSRNTAMAAAKAVKFWLENWQTNQQDGKGLYLFSGTKGSGKTRMAVSIANYLIRQKKIYVRFATSPQIISHIAASWEDGGEAALLSGLGKVTVLIIDDFGTEQVKPWIAEKFYQIINERYINRRITIFTSNMSLDNLEYDDRITNRIKECSYLIPFPEESVRDKIAEDNARQLRLAIQN